MCVIMSGIKEKLEGYVQQYGFNRRASTLYIAYDCYLSPGIQNLNNLQRHRIGHLFALKKREQIPLNLQQNYDELFCFDSSIKSWRNSEYYPNILRSLYDLSIRYHKNEETLKEVYLLLLTGSVKYFNIFDLKKLLIAIEQFFNLPVEFINSAVAKLKPKILKEALTLKEIGVLEEFFCLTPNPSELDDLMTGFYLEYEQKLVGSDSDYLDTAAWIIQRLGEIHFLSDGNGRLARRLAFDFIHLHENISFNEEEVINLGKHQAYIDATSRSTTPSRIRNWLFNTIQSKKMGVQAQANPSLTGNLSSFFNHPEAEKNNTHELTPSQMSNGPGTDI